MFDFDDLEYDSGWCDWVDPKTGDHYDYVNDYDGSLVLVNVSTGSRVNNNDDTEDCDD